MKKALISSFFLIVLGVIGYIWVLPSYLPEPPPARDYSAIGGDFTLNTVDGPVSRDDFTGQVVMLFFGFTHCPDYCLSSLATKRQVLHELTPEERERVRGLFVSVDPARDDLNTLAEYTAFFHPNIIGATSELPVVQAMADQFFASFYYVDTPDSELEYLVEHTTRTYILGPDGKVAGLFSYDASYQDILQRIRELLS